MASGEQAGQPVEGSGQVVAARAERPRPRGGPCAREAVRGPGQGVRLQRPLGMRRQQRSAPGAEGKAACTASPTTLNSTPPWASIARTSSARWRSTSAPSLCGPAPTERVLPSMSVKKKVTVPLGSVAIPVPAEEVESAPPHCRMGPLSRRREPRRLENGPAYFEKTALVRASRPFHPSTVGRRAMGTC